MIETRTGAQAPILVYPCTLRTSHGSLHSLYGHHKPHHGKTVPHSHTVGTLGLEGPTKDAWATGFSRPPSAPRPPAVSPAISLPGGVHRASGAPAGRPRPPDTIGCSALPQPELAKAAEAGVSKVLRAVNHRVEGPDSNGPILQWLPVDHSPRQGHAGNMQRVPVRYPWWRRSQQRPKKMSGTR